MIQPDYGPVTMDQLNLWDHCDHSNPQFDGEHTLCQRIAKAGGVPDKRWVLVKDYTCRECDSRFFRTYEMTVTSDYIEQLSLRVGHAR